MPNIAKLTDGNRNGTAWMDFYAKLRRKAIYAVVVSKIKNTIKKPKIFKLLNKL